jgi:hypothetical protein
MREESPVETMLRRLVEIEEQIDRRNREREEIKKQLDKLKELVEELRDGDQEEQK